MIFVGGIAYIKVTRVSYQLWEAVENSSKHYNGIIMQKKRPSSSSKATPSTNVLIHSNQTKIPIVGIGASAGGLEALEAFLRNIPDKCGAAFVIVQHLDPTYKDIMVELLQRISTIPVLQIADRMVVEANHVYVIPPNKNLSLLHGVLHLLDHVEPRGLRLPIDFFFQSLAADLEERSVGVILSGMGSDGMLGLRAIKEKRGGTFVQAPNSAKFEGMPRSAIDGCQPDGVASADKLPELILAYLSHGHSPLRGEQPLAEKVMSGLEKVVILLRTQTGQDFSLYKKSTIYRRIERRMGIHQIERIADYVHFLQENPHEIELLFKELLIGVTNFFRDPVAWEVLKCKVFPLLFAAKPVGGVLRAWVVGCSTGEEAYSLAIVFREVLESIKPLGNIRLQIFATDLDNDAIDRARSGCFPLTIANDVSAERLQRFFERDDHGYKIVRSIRETVVFAPQNVIMDPPFTRLDILVCRNLLIYMEPELQKKLFPLFHYSLNIGGVLFLGSAESLGSFHQLFKPIEAKARLFMKLQGIRSEPLALPLSYAHNTPSILSDEVGAQPKASTGVLNLQVLTEQVLLEHYTPPAVLTNDKGDIVYISGHTGKYLEPAAGKANWNIFAMARDGIRYELNLIFSSVLRKQGSVTKKGIPVSLSEGSQRINLTIRLLDKPEALRGLVLIVFEDDENVTVTTDTTEQLSLASGENRMVLLEQELSQARDEILIIREEMQTSQEELKSTNEEMQSANEELQSTNEELTTSKEEMQSMNEELQTINHELQSKVSDLSQANNDMKNLLNSTDIATLFLDDALNIRRFTTRTASLIKLIATDVGRPITDIVTDLHYPTLVDDAREVLQSLVFSEKEVSASNDRWFSVRIMPYRTQENRIVGLVITFSDISMAKKLEGNLRESENRFRFFYNSSPYGVLFFDREGKITQANPEAEKLLGYSLVEMVGKNVATLNWQMLREDGSTMPLTDFPVTVALQTAKPVTETVVGIVQERTQYCRWLTLRAVPRIEDGSSSPCEVFMTCHERDAVSHCHDSCNP
uniref:protein-glutamate O-methyltransferase n=1 Tax=Chlorobium chlorochromatii (strain CaD3) TaxID=340177 RepID=Q3AT39_CHLCH